MLTPKATTSYVDAQLLLQANQSTTYTKTEVDAALANKASTADMTAALALTADKLTTYTISQVDTALALKANQVTTYTKNGG